MFPIQLKGFRGETTDYFADWITWLGQGCGWWAVFYNLVRCVGLVLLGEKPGQRKKGLQIRCNPIEDPFR